MKRALVLLAFALPACAGNGAAPADDAAPLVIDAGRTADAASPPADAASPPDDAGRPGDAQEMPDAMPPDSALDAAPSDAAPPDATLADAGPRTDFTRPTGDHEVCDGVACYVEPRSGDWRFSDVVAVADDAFWIVGDRGIAFLEGGVYTYLEPIAPHPLNAIDGSARDLWAVGDSGTALHFDGDRWTRVPTGTTSTLIEVFVAHDGRAFAVGTGATALEYVAGAWRPIALGLSSTPRLYSVSEAGGELWIVGADRTVLHRVGGVVRALDRSALLCSRSYPGETIDYLGVYAAGPGDAFLSGRSNQSSMNNHRDVLVRAVGDAISCADQPAFLELDGTSATDVWGATSGLRDFAGNDADELAHWDGFDWTFVRVPALGSIALAGAHRAVALLGDDRAHVASTDGTTVTPIGDDYRNQLTNVTALEASPTGVLYFQDESRDRRTTLVRRGRDGAWQRLATTDVSNSVFAEVLDDEVAWWWMGVGHAGVADATGNLASFELPAFTSEVLPLSATTALIRIDGSASVVARYAIAGTSTPLPDTRPADTLFMLGTRILGEPRVPSSIDDPSTLELIGDTWTSTSLTRCPNELGIATFDRGAWSFNGAGCVIHLRADGTTGSFPIPSGLASGLSSAVVGLATADTAYAMINRQVYRLNGGTWTATTLAAGTATLRSIAVDRDYVWIDYDTGILRARHDAL